MSQIIIGYTTEGTTDIRFLESIIQRTFEWIAYECKGGVEVLPIINISKKPGPFIEQAMKCCRDANDYGIMIFCIHVDADCDDEKKVNKDKITPLLIEIKNNAKNDICSNIVPIIPVQMTEAWMLSDIELLKREIGTQMTNHELGLDKEPERIADPKATIENAILIARQMLVNRKRRELKISELYQPIGQKIELEKLDQLPSYRRFKESVRQAYRKINYI